MSVKKVIIIAVIAIVCGAILGGLSTLCDIDLDLNGGILPFVIPVIIIVTLGGVNQAITKKKNDEKNDDTDKN